MQRTVTELRQQLHEYKTLGTPEAKANATRILADLAAEEADASAAKRPRVSALSLDELLKGAKLDDWLGKMGGEAAGAAPGVKGQTETLYAFLSRYCGLSAAEGEQTATAEMARRRHIATAIAELLAARQPGITLEMPWLLSWVMKTLSMSSTAADLLARAVAGAPTNLSLVAWLETLVAKLRAPGGVVVRTDSDVQIWIDNVGHYHIGSSRAAIGQAGGPRGNIWTTQEIFHILAPLSDPPFKAPVLQKISRLIPNTDGWKSMQDVPPDFFKVGTTPRPGQDFSEQDHLTAEAELFAFDLIKEYEEYVIDRHGGFDPIKADPTAAAAAAAAAAAKEGQQDLDEARTHWLPILLRDALVGRLRGDLSLLVTSKHLPLPHQHSLLPRACSAPCPEPPSLIASAALSSASPFRISSVVPRRTHSSRRSARCPTADGSTTCTRATATGAPPSSSPWTCSAHWMPRPRTASLRRWPRWPGRSSSQSTTTSTLLIQQRGSRRGRSPWQR